MTENIARAELVNHLLHGKHGKAKKPAPIIESQCAALGAPEIFLKFDSEFTAEQLSGWLEDVQKYLPIEDSPISDLLFGILYNSEIFVKLQRTKEFPFRDVASFYKDKLAENKKYIAEFNKKEGGKINLNAPSNIVTRFPPEPSGYLHIGHAKAALLNYQLAKSGNGHMILRFDDTNPEKESSIFEKAILQDLALLNITDYTITHTSDRFEDIFEYAVNMIRAGKAYVDDTDVDTMREQRGAGIPSANRDRPAEESERLFKEMKDGGHPQCCLRAKISVDDPNKAMRDPVIYRCVSKPHHRTGDKYRIYPTYDFAVPILDTLEGVTLSLRTNEYRDRNVLYNWMADTLGLKNKPKIYDFSRLCFDNTVVSKRKMKFYVENKFLDGWDDPRLPTLRGLKNAGMDMEALTEYIRLQGASQKTAVNSWDKIWAINRRVIDPKSARYSAIPLVDIVEVDIEGVDRETISACARHRKNPDLGSKQVLFPRQVLMAQEDARALADSEEFTLMNWGNAVLIKRDMQGAVVKSMRIRLHLEGDFKATTNKFTWIPRRGSVQIRVTEYDTLLNATESDDPVAQFNTDSKHESWWVAENAIKDAVAGDTIQIERVGFFYCKDGYSFNLIPYTKQKRVR